MQHPSSTEVVSAFYQAFSRCDGAAMTSLYSDKIQFSDPVFPELTGAMAKAMWQMLCKRAKGLEIKFAIVNAVDQNVTATWTASYLFQGGAGRPRQVVNHIKAKLQVIDGKIVSHHDQFDFWGWSRQAFGPAGLLLGWLPWFQRKVQRTARANLERFIRSQLDQ